MIIEFQQGEMVLQAQDVPIGEILEEIFQKHQVEIVGLEHREEETITFSAKGKTLEDVLRRLFRYLKEENCAFEFTDVKLKRVSVLPKSKGKGHSRPVRTERKAGRKTSVVRVIGIIKGSQAEELGLKIGDLIIEYDGVKIRSAQQLVREVKKKSDSGQVEMTVVRDRSSSPYVLNGGKIGVRISTAKIPKEEFDTY
ncbi:PDZ domain-containing protein [Desulfobacterales bacterium HSG2]|nr:PDZ domain-containing protein [Desulfobacterales bacterium HSG2]